MTEPSVPLSVLARYGRAIARVFQAPPDPAEAIDILASLLEVVGERRAIGFSIDPFSLKTNVRAYVGMDGEAAERFICSHQTTDPWMRGLLRVNTPGELIITPDLRMAQELGKEPGRSAFLHDLDELGIVGCAGAIIRVEDGRLICIAVYPDDPDGLSPFKRELLGLVVRQLGYSSVLRANRIAAETERQVLAATLDLCQMPVIIVDGRGMVVRRNEAAMRLLHEGDVLQVKGGRLTSANAADASHLATQISRVTTAGKDLTATWHTSSTESGRVVGMISCIRAPETASGGMASFAVISVADLNPRHRNGMTAGILREIFDLTEAEERVAKLIDAGHSATSVAELTGLSLATVRTHLSRIFEKTETGSQPELVRLLSLLGPFRPPTPSSDRAAPPAGNGREPAPSQPKEPPSAHGKGKGVRHATRRY